MNQPRKRLSSFHEIYKSESYSSYGRGPTEKIPVYAVGYQGYQSQETLMKRMRETRGSARPDGVLILDPGILIGNDVTDGGTIMAKDAAALYRLISIINALLNSMQFISFDYEKYIK